MKVLLAHNFYRSNAPSGEDGVFRNERQLLESRGVEVVSYERFNDDIDDRTLPAKIRVALDTAWSDKSFSELNKILRKERPDIVHFHNTFPLISPSAYAACRENRIPVVQTLHNYRLICPGGLLLRDGRPCEACVGRSLYPALRHACYRDSHAATAAVVCMLWRNRMAGAYSRRVDRYIALTQFAARRLIAGGLPAAQLAVKPNFLPNPPQPNVSDNAGHYAIYVGRLTTEKGVKTLISAWRSVPNLPLKIVGDGALSEELKQAARDAKLPIEFCGFRPHAEVLELIKSARLQIIPSECYEGFPLSVLEAFACGTPVVASRLGGLAEIVEEGVTGVLCTPADPQDLARKINELLAKPEQWQRLRRQALNVFEQRYTADINFQQLMQIYQDASKEHLLRYK